MVVFIPAIKSLNKQIRNNEGDLSYAIFYKLRLGDNSKDFIVVLAILPPIKTSKEQIEDVKGDLL